MRVPFSGSPLPRPGRVAQDLGEEAKSMPQAEHDLLGGQAEDAQDRSAADGARGFDQVRAAGRRLGAHLRAEAGRGGGEGSADQENSGEALEPAQAERALQGTV